MAENIYPYAVARVRVLEKNLLTNQDYVQMADAKNADDALRMIIDAGYGDQTNQINAHDYEAILSEELKKMYQVVKGLIPEENFIEIFLVKNDYHNLKVLIKQEISGVDGSKYLIDGGIYNIEMLKDSILNRNFNNLNDIMASAVKEAYDIYSKTKNGQMIDIVLDKAVFKQMKKISNESKNSFVTKYVSILCDLTNLKSLLRIKSMNKGFEMFSTVYLSGGTLDLEVFRTAFENDNTISSFKATDYYKILEESNGKGFTLFEKLCDDFVMEFLKDAKFKALTLEPVVAYVYAKESEVKVVRIIMTSKLNNIDSETIKERLREAYV